MEYFRLCVLSQIFKRSFHRIIEHWRIIALKSSFSERFLKYKRILNGATPEKQRKNIPIEIVKPRERASRTRVSFNKAHKSRSFLGERISYKEENRSSSAERKLSEKQNEKWETFHEKSQKNGEDFQKSYQETQKSKPKYQIFQVHTGKKQKNPEEIAVVSSNSMGLRFSQFFQS